MIEILDWIFESAWHYIGTLLLIMSFMFIHPILVTSDSHNTFYGFKDVEEDPTLPEK